MSRWDKHKKIITGISFDGSHAEDTFGEVMKQLSRLDGLKEKSNQEYEEEPVYMTIRTAEDDPDGYDIEICGSEADIADMLLNELAAAIELVEQEFGKAGKMTLLLEISEFLKGFVEDED